MVNTDVPPRDLQQCTDGVIRPRAEYVFSQDLNKAHFHVSTGYNLRIFGFCSRVYFGLVKEEVRPAMRCWWWLKTRLRTSNTYCWPSYMPT